MPIVKVIEQDEFVNLFELYDRSNNFSVAARRKLFEYFEELSEENLNHPYQIDIIDICCKWTEYGCKREVVETYQMPGKTFDETWRKVWDNTTVLCVPYGPYADRYLIHEF